MKTILASLLLVALTSIARGVTVGKAGANRERANRPRGSADTERGIRRAEGLAARNQRESLLDVVRSKSAPLNRRAEALVELNQSKLTLREAFSRELATYKLVKAIQSKQPLENPLSSKAAAGDQRVEVAAAIKVLDERHAIRIPLTRLDLQLRKRAAVKGIAAQIGKAETLEEAKTAHDNLVAAVGAEDPGTRRTADALGRRAWKEAKIGRQRGDVELASGALHVARQAEGDSRRGFDERKAQHLTAETAQRAAERLVADGDYRAADAVLEHIVPVGGKANAGSLRTSARLGEERQSRLLELGDLAMNARNDGTWQAAERAADHGDARSVRASVREVMRVERRRDNTVGSGTLRRQRELLRRAARRASTAPDKQPADDGAPETE